MTTGQSDSEPQPIEQLDIVTATGEFIRSADRDLVHREGHWHQVFHCLVLRSGAPARVVLQRRHRAKAVFPGLLDLSATGHLEAGEQPLEGVRELNEELGTCAGPDDLVPIGVRLLADDNGEGLNRERVHLYFTVDDRPLDRFALEPSEVESLVDVEAGPLLAMLDRDADDAGTATVEAVEWYPGSPPRAVTITASDLIKPVDGYWAVLLTMAERFAAGHRPVAI